MKRRPSRLLKLCRLILEYSESGISVKDAIEPSDYTPDELIVELAAHYRAANDRD